MRNKLLLFSATMAAMLCLNTTKSMAQEIKLVSDNIEIPLGKQYRMYMTEYSDKIYDHLQTNPRIAVDFESDDETIVQGYQYFTGIKEGTTTVNMKVYAAVDAWGTPDWTKLIDEKTFTVTVKDRVVVSIPTINTSWGISREEVSNIITNQYGYENATETYFKMNPIAAADPSASMFEIYNTNIFEFPLVYSVFNDEDRMIAYQFVISNYERAWNTADLSDAPIIKILENNGYTLYGKDESGRPALYNPTTYTLVTFDNFILQGQFFMFCTFEYEENNPLDPEAITLPTGENPTIEVNTNGQAVEIGATGHDGDVVEVFNTNGQLIGKTTIANGKAVINTTQKGVVIVKVGNIMPMKVSL